MEDQQIIETLTAFLESEAARFEPWEKGQYDKTPHKRAGYYRDTEQTWFIFPSVFRNEICRGMDSTRAARILHERGYIAKKDRDSFTASTRLPDGQARVYVIRRPANATARTVSPVSPVSGNNSAGSGETVETARTGATVSAKRSNGEGETVETVETVKYAEQAFSELSTEHLELIGRAVDLINSELGEGSYSPESFFAAIPEADRDKLTSKVIGRIQDRIRFGPGADG